MGYCPFPSLGQDTAYCIVTQQGCQGTIGPSGCMLGRTVGLPYGHPRVRHSLRHSQPAREASAPALLARACDLASEVCCDTMFHIVTKDNGTTLRYNAAVRHDTAQGATTRTAGFGSRYNLLYRDQRGRRYGSLRARHGQCTLRHGLQHSRARP